MADSVGAIYVSLGLNLSELETDLVAADRTINENVRRLSRESNLIQLRAEVEIAGLDETADAERILQVRQEALNRQMAIQRDRVRILTAELQSLTAAHGKNSVATQRAAIRLERERLALANLERESRQLNDTTDESNSIFDEFSNLLSNLPAPLKAIGLAAKAAGAGIVAAGAAVNDLMEQFRELEKQSYELNMPFADTRDFLRQVKLGGGDIGDIEGYIRGITDAYVKGEYDDPEFIALRKYGAQITDATGRLKDFKDIFNEVYQAWEKADAAGEGIEFLQLTGGEAGVRDVLEIFQRLKEAREDAEKVYKANIDADELHKLERSFNLATTQAGEFKAAVGDIFVPAAQAASEKFFEALHQGTEYLVENKDEIQRWGFIAVETFSTVAEKWRELTSYSMPDTGDKDVDKAFDRMNWQASAFNEQSLWGSNSLVGNAYSEFFGDIGKYLGITERAEEAQRAYNDELSETGTASEVAAKGLEALLELHKKINEETQDKNPLNQYDWKRINAFKQELEDLRIELDFGDNDYEKAKAQIELWRQRELAAKNFLSDEERAAIEALSTAKLEQIEQERADKLAEIREKVAAADRTALENKLANIEKERQTWLKAGMDEAEATELAQQRIIKARAEAAEKTQEYLRNAADIEYSLTHTAFEKEMRDIEQWKTAQMKKADTAEEVAAIIANAAAKEAEAFEREVDRIKGKIETLEDKIFAQEHSQYEVDLRNLQKERQELYNEGLPAEMIERYYKNALGELRGKAEKARKDKSDYTKNPKGNTGWGVIDFGQKQPEPVSAYQQAIDITAKKYGISADIVTAARERETQAIIDQTQALRGQYEVMEWGNGVINSWGSGGDFNGKSAPYEVIGWGDASNGVIERRDNVQPFNAEKFYQRLPEQLEEIKKDMLEGNIKKWRDNYQTESEHYDNLFTFNAQRTAAGMSDEEAQRLLDNIYDEVTRIRQQENTTEQSRAEIGSSESQSVVAGISREVEQRADINRQDGYVSTPDTDLLTPLNEMAQTIERQFEASRPSTQTVTLSPQAISALQSRQSKNQPKVTNNITVQVENVNADELERVNEAADLIADKVREAVNSMGDGMNLSYAS